MNTEFTFCEGRLVEVNKREVSVYIGTVNKNNAGRVRAREAVILVGRLREASPPSLPKLAVI